MSFQLVRVDILVVFVVSFLTLLASAFMLRGTKLRQIPTVEASFEAVRVATEKGTPLLFDTGWTGANFWGHSSGLTTLAFVPSTLELLKRIAKEAGPLGVRVITGTTNAVYAMMSHDFMESGYAESGHIEEALKLGAKAFLHKPYRINYLLETVRSVLDEKDLCIRAMVD